jgi:hypothetical protein
MCRDDDNFRLLTPNQPRRHAGASRNEKLAKLVADKVSAGEKDPIRIRDGLSPI